MDTTTLREKCLRARAHTHTQYPNPIQKLHMMHTHLPPPHTKPTCGDPLLHGVVAIALTSGRDIHTTVTSRHQRMTSRRAAWILLQSPEDICEFEQAFASELCARCPSVAAVHQLAREFRLLMKSQDGAGLDPWLAKAATTELSDSHP